ncbi:MAG: glycosyltransferase family 4 protein [Hyphomicrobiaceae bacterium]
MPDLLPDVIFAIPGDIHTQTGGYAYDRRIMSLLPALGLKHQRLQLPGSFPNPTQADLTETEKLLTAIAADKVLVIDGLAFGALPASIIDQISCRIIALVHHPLALESGISAADQKRLAGTEKNALAQADAVIITGPSMQPILECDYDVPAHKITVARPGTNPALRATGTGTPLQLLSVGAISTRKGYDVLISALEPLRHLDWRLTIAGAQDRDPDVALALKKQVESSGMTDRIALPGIVVPATLERFYETADIFVMPSLFEGYGMVLAEAMACGLPIVCTTGGAAAFTVPDGAALKVPPGNIEALTEALAQALNDRKLRAKLADAAWEAGRKLPTWNETARKFAEVIMELKS